MAPAKKAGIAEGRAARDGSHFQGNCYKPSHPNGENFPQAPPAEQGHSVVERHDQNMNVHVTGPQTKLSYGVRLASIACMSQRIWAGALRRAEPP
jgi:hypothetical protein